MALHPVPLLRESVLALLGSDEPRDRARTARIVSDMQAPPSSRNLGPKPPAQSPARSPIGEIGVR